MAKKTKKPSILDQLLNPFFAGKSKGDKPAVPFEVSGPPLSRGPVALGPPVPQVGWAPNTVNNPLAAGALPQTGPPLPSGRPLGQLNDGPVEEDGVVAALQRVLAGIPGAPDRGAYFAPFGEARGRAQEAYDAAGPQITDAYNALRTKIGTGNADTQAQLAAAQAQQAQLAGAGADQVRGLQAQAFADLQRNAGDPSLGSLTSAAQAQAGANDASLRLQASQGQQLASGLQNSAAAQGADRLSAANTMETASKDNARANLSQILNAIGMQEMDAQGKYQDMVSQFNAQRGEAEVAIAKAKAGKEQTEGDMLDLMLKRQQIEKNQKALDGENKPQLPSAANFGDVAQRSPNAFGVFSELVAKNGTKGDRLSAEKLLGEAISAGAEDGSYLPDKDSLKINGNRISLGWLRTWLDQYYGGGGGVDG